MNTEKFNNIIDINQIKANSETKINFKTIIALAIVGYVFNLFLASAEGILLQLIELLALYLLPNSDLFYFYGIIPKLIVIAFWCFLVFNIVPKYNGQINLKKDLPKDWQKK